MGYTREVAEDFHRDMSIYTFGMAMMANSGYHPMEEKEIKEKLDRQFSALTSIYGTPPNFL